MIHIQKDQTIPENENIRVFSPTGDYNDTDLIEYYSAEDPTIPQGAYHAQFVKYGGLVYRFNDPKELGAEILKIEPDSTHSAASFVRMQNELSKQFDQGSLEPTSLNQVLETEQVKMEEEISNPSEKIESENVESDSSDLDIDTKTEDLTDTGVTEVSSTTAPIIPDLSTDDSSESIPSTPATSTEQVIEEVLGESTDPETETASTTSEIISYAKKAIKKNITRKIKSKILG